MKNKALRHVFVYYAHAIRMLSLRQEPSLAVGEFDVRLATMNLPRFTLNLKANSMSVSSAVRNKLQLPRVYSIDLLRLKFITTVSRGDFSPFVKDMVVR